MPNDADPPEVPPAVLFLCTGNYYRSRFAEELWNDLERRDPTGWRAQSRGITFAHSGGNIGPISPYARRALVARDVVIAEPLRMPRRLEHADLAAAAHVVALSRDEHRPMLADRFPRWVDGIEYWDVDDVALCAPKAALDRVEVHVRRLRARIPRVLDDTQRTTRNG